MKDYYQVYAWSGTVRTWVTSTTDKAEAAEIGKVLSDKGITCGIIYKPAPDRFKHSDEMEVTDNG